MCIMTNLCFSWLALCCWSNSNHRCFVIETKEHISWDIKTMCQLLFTSMHTHVLTVYLKAELMFMFGAQLWYEGQKVKPVVLLNNCIHVNTWNCHNNVTVERTGSSPVAYLEGLACHTTLFYVTKAAQTLSHCYLPWVIVVFKSTSSKRQNHADSWRGRQREFCVRISFGEVPCRQTFSSSLASRSHMSQRLGLH